MATQQFDTPPPARANRWQDWANLVLAIWLFISPWVLQFALGGQAAAPGAPGGGAAPAAVGGGTAAWNAWVLGVIIFLVAVSALGRMAASQEWINLVLGIWVFIAPWVLGFVPLQNASWDHWIVGALVFLISAWSLAETRRRPAAVEMAHAGDKPQRRL
jgi:hypothetical protein